MIAGRPTNLWLGLTTALVGFGTVVAVAAGADATMVANIAGSLGGVLGALILLVANQTPTVNAGDSVKVITEGDAPNKTVTV